MYTGLVNDREFRRYLAEKRLERQRQEVEAANAEVRASAELKKPPASAKAKKVGKKRPA